MQAEYEPLLVLQERDVHLQEIEAQLARIPLEISVAEDRIAAEREAIATERQKVKELEVRRKDLDNDLKSVEDQLTKFKNQQLNVKKNEEYQALTHEIETTETRIGELEEQEIGLLIDIDTANETLTEIERERNETIALHEGEIAKLRQREQELQQQHAQAATDASDAEGNVDPRYLQAYKRVRQRKIRPPYVVQVTDHKCGGCHLKLAGETETSLHQRSSPVNCENCGRLVYLP